MNPLLFGVMRAPRRLIFGPGQRATLPRFAAELGKRALVVTDPRMGGEAALHAMVAGLESAGLAVRVFDQVAAELPLGCIADGITAGQQHAADVVIAVGGGSCIDAAKIIGLILTHGGTPDLYYGENRVPGPILPLIVLPTTSGTGSEVTPVAVLDDPARAVKIGIASAHLIPEIAICDPELTMTCPPGLTAASGADALTHAIEAFTNLRRPVSAELSLDHVFVGKNSLSDFYALEAIRLIGRSLARAVEDGSDAEARADMMLGSTLAGLAFGVAGTAAAHAIQYPVGALTHTAHGVGVAVLMPYVMAWNSPACTVDLACIGEALGLPQAGSTSERAAATIWAVGSLFARIGIPRTLADLGVKPDDLERITTQALAADRLVKNNPRKLDVEGMAQIVVAAFNGTNTEYSTPASPQSKAEVR
jgi:alcohol dehydrogenase class IV